PRSPAPPQFGGSAPTRDRWAHDSSTAVPEVPAVIPSISERTTPAAAEPRAATPRARHGWGSVTAADFRTVTELESADSDDELTSRLGELDRARLEDMARQGYLDGHDQGRRDGYEA